MQPVVVLMGARQTGKSRLVRHHPVLADRPYHPLDSVEVRAQAAADPLGFLRSAPFLVLDEIQRATDLILAIKQVVDADGRRPGQFVLTGSANLLELKGVKDTLAGRASYTTLWPLTRRERLGQGRAGRWSELIAAPVTGWTTLLAADAAPAEDWREAGRRSAYPTPALSDLTAAQQTIWLQGYLDTYLDRDIAELANIAKPLDLRRLMQAVCVNVGQIENQANWGRAAAMKSSTVLRYLDLLEMSYQLLRIPAFAVNRSKRLALRPKVFWSDTALALHIAGNPPLTGFHLENMIAMDLTVWSWAEAQRPGILHWRTHTREEVDFVIEMPDGRLLPIEVKADSRPGWSDAGGLRVFLDDYADRAPGGLVLHGGNDIYRLSDRIVAAPWWSVI